MLFHNDVDHDSDPFTKPSLIILGRQDYLVGYRDAFRLVDRYPGASFAILDSAGHAMQIDQEHRSVHWLLNGWIG